MLKKKIYVYVSLFAAVVLCNCAGYQDYKGESIIVKINEEVTIKMEADTANGYKWMVSEIGDKDIAKYTGRDYISGELSTSFPIEVLKFRGLKKGKTTISLNYVKKGNLLVKKSRTFNLTVY